MALTEYGRIEVDLVNLQTFPFLHRLVASQVPWWHNRLADPLVTREEHVAEQLRHAILIGHFRPGEKLDQTEICKQLNVSLSPVREAIRTLAAEGLVTVQPHRGAFVAERSPEELKELNFIRGLLEGVAIRRAVPHLTDAALAQLGDILRYAEQTEDPEIIQLLNHEFHWTIYSSYPQQELLDIIAKLRNKVAPYIRLYLDAGMRSLAWADHQRIYEACVRRDVTQAEVEIRRHIEQISEGILLSLTKATASASERPV
ncbi:MAG: GntR family transcriptional regulator [Alicyclobacillus sp.]|nr:GntR family transcriptional regulator [Alicyclobacillus sp.]